MRCKFCAAPLPAKGLTCDYCGQRNPLNLNVLSKVDIEHKNDHRCPVCEVTFDNINIGIKTRVLIQRCNSCDGIFVSEDILEQLMKDKRLLQETIDLHVLRFVKDNPRQQKQTNVVYRNCPVCEKIMQRFNYKTTSGVVVDRCLRHGIWLDGGELHQLFEWKKAGGGVSQKQIQVKTQRSKATIFNQPPTSPAFDPIGNFLNWIQGA